MKSSLRLAATLFALLLFAFSASLIITKYVWAAPNLQTDDIPLYSKLSWSETGAEDRSFTLDQGGSYFRLPGIGFQSKGISTKPSADIIEFYSQKNLGSLGWGLVNSEAGGLIIVQTYFKHPNTYLVVKMGGCRIAFSQQQLGPGSAPEFCVSVWHSSFAGTVPIPEIQPQPPSPPSAKPATVNYSNPLPVPTFSQNDSSWKNDRQGWPDAGYPTACDFCTLGGYGCWTTSYSMLYNYYSSNNTNPHNLNSNLNSGPNGGPRYASNGAHCNNLMPGGSPYAPSGVSRIDGVPGIYNACASSNCIDFDKVALIQGEINAGRPVLVFVHYSGTSPQHMVVITGYNGSNTWYINDPWDGGRRTLASGALGAYVVDYIMRWNGTPPGGGGGGPSGYTFCVNENERCNFSGTKDVAYGANGSFYYKYNITGGIDCNNSTFGDPISGVGKACYTKDSSTQQCNPNSDQIALYVDANYSGQCATKGIGDYTNPGAIGLPNDSISSVKVGGNVKVKLCRDDNYGSTCEDFTGDDGNLSDNSIGDNQVSSAKVENRPSGCSNTSAASNEVVIFADQNYGGNCLHLSIGDYPNPGYLGGVGNDNAESIRVGSSAQAILCQDDNYGGTCTGALTSDISNLDSTSLHNNQLSSLHVQTRATSNGAQFISQSVPTNLSPNQQATVSITMKNTGTSTWLAQSAFNLGSQNPQDTMTWGINRLYPTSSIAPGNTWTFTFYILAPTAPGTYNFQWRMLQENVGWFGDFTTNVPITVAQSQPPPIPALSSPADGTTVNEGDDITLAWNSAANATGYHAEYWGGPAGYVVLDWQNVLSWHIGPQWAGYTYAWHAEAHNAVGWSGWTDSWHFTVKLRAPSNAQASSSSCNQVNLLWSDNSGNEEGYHIYRDGNQIAQLGANTSSYQDLSVNGNTSYSYVVKAYRSNNESDTSNTANIETSPCNVVPTMPNNLRVTATTATAVTLAWDDMSDNEDGFMMYRWNGIDFVPIGSVGANVTTFTDTTTNCNIGYSYNMTAYNAFGESAHTPWVDAHTQSCPLPNTPTLISPRNGSQRKSNSRLLVWTSSEGATYYKVQVRQGTTKGKLVANGTTDQPQWSTPNLAKGYWYWWRVRACSASNECSSWSSTWRFKVK